MAWYALYKKSIEMGVFRGENMIQWYRRHLYDEWYNGLSEEDRATYDEMKEREYEEDKVRLDRSLAVMGNIFSHIYGRAYPHSHVEDTYGAQDAIANMRNFVRGL